MLLLAALLSPDSLNSTDSGPGITGARSSIAAPDRGGAYTAGSLTSIPDGAPLTGLDTVANPESFTVPDGHNFTYDNLITVGTGPQLDLNGVLFTVPGQSQPMSLDYDTNSHFDALHLGGAGYPPMSLDGDTKPYYGALYVGGAASYPNGLVLTPLNSSVTPTPESSSLILLGIGLLGLAWVVRRTPHPSRQL
jgi:hypothetical protein